MISSGAFRVLGTFRGYPGRTLGNIGDAQANTRENASRCIYDDNATQLQCISMQLKAAAMTGPTRQ